MSSSICKRNGRGQNPHDRPTLRSSELGLLQKAILCAARPEKEKKSSRNARSVLFQLFLSAGRSSVEKINSDERTNEFLFSENLLIEKLKCFNVSGAEDGGSRKFRDFLQEWPTPGTGPYFDTSINSNITGLVGKTVLLHCRVKNLGNRTVSDSFIKWFSVSRTGKCQQKNPPFVRHVIYLFNYFYLHCTTTMVNVQKFTKHLH